MVLGAGGVGKSCMYIQGIITLSEALILQFVRQTFCDDYDPTVGKFLPYIRHISSDNTEDAYLKIMDLDGERMQVDILDTAV